MTRLRWLFALPALMLATATPALASEVRDKAGMFSPEAVKKAQSELDRIEGEYKVPVTIETVASLNGDTMREVTTRHAEAVGAKGMYILISKGDKDIYGEPSRGYQKHLTVDRFKAIALAFRDGFKKGDFDSGLGRGVAKIDSTLSEAKAEAGGSLVPAPAAGARRVGQAPVRVAPAGAGRAKESWGMGSLLMIVLGILGIFLVIRVVGALLSGGRGGYANQARMGGPGYGPGGGPGGPGYGGGGGGGFMSSMFGGIGGALAGNWLYDQFSGRNHGSVDQTSTYDPAAGAAPGVEAGPEWGEGGAGANWGDGGTPDAGGDWGGGGADTGGGGDWGGGGGGDWGGGGGGDDGGGW